MGYDLYALARIACTQQYLSLRYMGLTDLMSEINQDPSNFVGDEAVENKVLRQVLKLVEDKISELKNQAVKWCIQNLDIIYTSSKLTNAHFIHSLGVLIKIVRESQMEVIIGKLIEFSGSKDEELRDIAGLGLCYS